jgi:hypothetical protein
MMVFYQSPTGVGIKAELRKLRDGHRMICLPQRASLFTCRYVRLPGSWTLLSTVPAETILPDPSDDPNSAEIVLPVASSGSISGKTVLPDPSRSTISRKIVLPDTPS